MTGFGQGFEGLEDRTLLAANVSATLVGGTLYVTGDATVNDITVNGAGVAGEVNVTIAGLGQTLAQSGGVTVSGTQASFTGVTDVVIKGNDGNDIINVADINISGNLNANGNAGTDSVSLQSLLADTTIGGGVVLFGGGGVDDSVSVLTESGSVTDLTIGAGLNLQNNGGVGGIQVNAFGSGDISIGGGLLVNETSVALGAGSVEIGNHGLGNVSIGANVIVNGGAGNDQLELNVDGGTGLSIGGNLTVNGGAGNDVIGMNASGSLSLLGHDINVAGTVQFNGNDGNDDLSVSASTASINLNKLLMIGGVGDDSIHVEAAGDFGLVNLTTHLRIDGNDGNDVIGVRGINANGGAIIFAGLGDDTIAFQNNSVAANASIYGDDGLDQILVASVAAGGNLELFGGAGVDSSLMGFNTFGAFQIINQIENQVLL